MRRRQASLGLVIPVAIGLFFLTGNLPAQTVSELHIFTSTPDGAYPSAMLVQGRDGNMYGTTEQGGANTCNVQGYITGCGTIFRMDTVGNVTLLHSFDGTDGSIPQGVILASDGYFYGAAAENGANGFGTLFRMSAGGAFTKLYDFSGGVDGRYPQDQLLQASDGNFYGFTEDGMYRATPAGTVATIYAFTGYPVTYNKSPLIQATDGFLYQSMAGGWCHGSICPCGSIVKFNLQGQQLSQHDFSCFNTSSGEGPFSPVTEGTDGSFYGTCVWGGSGGRGTAFRLDARTLGLTLLHSYDVTSEEPNTGVVQASDGNFYGVVQLSSLAYSGEVFQLTPDGKYTELAGLPYHGEDFPYWKLLAHTNGKFYSVIDGAENQPGYYGSAYSFDNGFAPFITFVQPRGRVGGTAQILGQGLRGTWAVTFNGIPATSFKVISDTYMTAVVPGGATTGPVVVSTPSGLLTSNRKFQIVHGH